MPMLGVTTNSYPPLAEGRRERFLDALRRVLRFGEPRVCGEHHDELVAADARELRARAGVGQPRRQSLRDLREQRIPGLVTERVVDPLKLIEVHEQQRRAALAVGGLGEGLRQVLPDPFAVRQPGERIEVGQTMNVRFGLLALRDVAHDGEHLTRGIGQIAALEMPADRRLGLQGKLEGCRRAAQRGVKALHGARQHAVRQQITQVQGARGMRLHGRQPGDGAEAMADGAGGIHQEDAVGDGFQQRGVLLLREAQRLDGARAARVPH